MADINVGQPIYRSDRQQYSVIFYSGSQRGLKELARTFNCRNGMAFVATDTIVELHDLIREWIELWTLMGLTILSA